MGITCAFVCCAGRVAGEHRSVGRGRRALKLGRDERLNLLVPAVTDYRGHLVGSQERGEEQSAPSPV